MRAVDGASLRAIAQGWVAFSPLSGETIVLNDTSAAMIEVLQERGPSTRDAVAEEISQLTHLAASSLAPVLAPAWNALLSMGLVTEVQEPPRTSE